MSLIQCKECSESISSKAKTCPKCGAPVPQPTFGGVWALVFGVIGIIIFGKLLLPSSAPHPSPPSIVSINKSEAMQADRKKLIEELLARKVFSKVELERQVPQVWVTPYFGTLDFEMKQNFISVVYAYKFSDSRPMNVVNLKDSRTGNDIGDYSTSNPGLKLK